VAVGDRLLLDRDVGVRRGPLGVGALPPLFDVRRVTLASEFQLDGLVGQRRPLVAAEVDLGGGLGGRGRGRRGGGRGGLGGRRRGRRGRRWWRLARHERGSGP